MLLDIFHEKWKMLQDCKTYHLYSFKESCRIISITSQNILGCFFPYLLLFSLFLLDGDDYLTVAQSLKKEFDSPEISDLKFLVDGKCIHVHKALLKIRYRDEEALSPESTCELREKITNI